MLVFVVAALGRHAAADALVLLAMRDSACVYVHNAAYSTIAVEKGRGTLKYFDAVGDKWLHRRGVVTTGYRHIHSAKPVFHYPNPSPTQSMNDRSAYRSTKAGRMNAGLFSQHLA